MNPKKLYTTIGLIIVFVGLFFVKKSFTGPLYQDEHHYLPTAVLFSTDVFPTFEILTTYNELNTPVPFVLGGWVVKAFGADIQFLRLLTYLVSFSLLMLFVWTSPGVATRFWLCLLGLLAFPNYYLCSVYYYTDIFAMVSVLAGVVFYMRNVHWAGFLFFVIAISSRQYMLAFPAAIAAYEVFKASKWNPAAVLRQMLLNRTWIYYALAVLSILPWILLWHGLAPAKVMAEQFYGSDQMVDYRPGYILYSSACVAVYYVIPEMVVTRKWSYFLAYPKKYPRFFVALVVLIVLLVAFFPAKQAYNPYFTWPFLGYVDQAFETVGLTGLIKQLCFAALMLITCMRFFSPDFHLTGWLVLVNMLLLGKAQLSWDKYSLPLIMVLWYLAMFDFYWLPKEETDMAPEAGGRVSLDARG